MLLWIVGIIIILVVVGIIYQQIAAAKDSRTYQPPGQLIDIGDRRLHMVVMGEDKEKPTVILEAGMASFSSNWYWVQTDLAAETRVIAYDRAGLGWSDSPPATQHAYESAEDLHRALESAGISGPYVLAGHSYGGLVIRAFADLYSDEVVGMVLVDASHPDQWGRMSVSRNGQVNAFTTRLTGWLAYFGVVRLFGLGNSLGKGLPERSAAEMEAIFNQPQSWTIAGKTLGIWHSETRPRINQAQSLGDLPLLVLSVTEQPLMGDVLTELQEELPTLSTNSVRTVVQGATHENLVAEHKHALVVTAAIRQVMEAAQSGRPLSDFSESTVSDMNQ